MYVCLYTEFDYLTLLHSLHFYIIFSSIYKFIFTDNVIIIIAKNYTKYNQMNKLPLSVANDKIQFCSADGYCLTQLRITIPIIGILILKKCVFDTR